MIAKLLIGFYKNQIIETYQKEFNAGYLRSVNKPIGFSDLQYKLTDLEGRKYYDFPIGMNIGLERLAKLNSLMAYNSAKISEEELYKILDAADVLLTDGLKTGKNAAKIGALHSELRERPKMTMHVDLLYHIAAAGLIREDEVIDHYDNDIQMQKVIQFKKEVAAQNSYFFFHQLGLQSISNLYQLSEEEWNESWNRSLEKLMALPEVLKIVSLKG